MSKIEIISPIHIASGNEYHVAYVDENGYGYTLETVLINAVSYDNSKNILFSIANKNNLSREDFIKNLEYSKEKLTREHAIKHKGVISPAFQYKNVSEAARTLDKLYIPGSSLKGYIINVAWNYIIQNNKEVKNFFIEKFSEISRKHRSNFDNALMNLWNSEGAAKKECAKNLKTLVTFIEKNDYNYREVKSLLKNEGIKKVQELIGTRDVIFMDEFEIKATSRVHKEQQETFIPTPCVEVIPIKSVSKGEFIFFPKRHFKNLTLDSILKFCENEADILEENLASACGAEKDTLAKKLAIARERERISKIVVQCFYNYFTNFNEWFSKANKEFISKIVKYEREYVASFQGTKINVGKLNEFYDSISKLLDDNKIIIRIGKNTNYILKTIGSAFDNDFKKYFKYVFSPSNDYTKFKVKPDLLTTTFYRDIDNDYKPLGYAVIEL